MRHHIQAGRKGGQSRSEKKLVAVRENGKLGGRPRYPVSLLHTFSPAPDAELLQVHKDVALRRGEQKGRRLVFRPLNEEERLEHLRSEHFMHRKRSARELVRYLRSNNIWAKTEEDWVQMLEDRRRGVSDVYHVEVDVLIRDRDRDRALRAYRDWDRDQSFA